MIDEILNFIKDKNIAILGFGLEGKSIYNFIRRYLKYKKIDIRVNFIDKKDIVQDENIPQKEAIAEFKSDINSVLLGTGSYWEGVNVEGEALSSLVIFKLPFPVPDPIYERKMELSENGLMDVLVPEMVLKLKQGESQTIRN